MSLDKPRLLDDHEPLHTLASSRGSIDDELQSWTMCPHDPSFETARYSAHYNVPTSAQEVALDDERTTVRTEAAAAVHDQSPVEFESHHIAILCKNDEGMIAREVMSAVKGMVSNQ